MRKTLSKFIAIIEDISSLFFDSVITATDYILCNFRSHRLPVSIKNYPIVADYQNIINLHEKSNEIINLIFAGGIYKDRCITELITSMGLTPLNNKIKLTLVGEFSPPEYQHELSKLTAYHMVEYLGWVEPHNIPALLMSRDCGIILDYPYNHNITALPVKMFEYMAAGIPVIASNFPLWKEIIEGNNCGICVDSLKPQEIAAAIQYLIDHPDDRKKMGENGKRAVIEKYNWESESKKLLNIYKEVTK